MKNRNKTIPTESQIDLLLSDWFGNKRSQETFIHKDTKGAIHRVIESDENYSNYFTGGMDSKNDMDCRRAGRNIAQNIVNIISDEPIKVSLGGEDSFTDGKQVVVASEHFRNEDLTNGQKIDILAGFAVHEACHLKHTDFSYRPKERKEGSNTNRLRKLIANIIEDERIELLLGKSMEDGGDGLPGLADYLAIIKRYIWGTLPEEQAIEPVAKFINVLLKAIRFPAALSRKEVAEHFDHLEQVRRLLIPYPNSTPQAYAAADGIIDVIKEIVKDEQLDDNQRQAKKQSSEEKNDRDDQNQNEENKDAGQDSDEKEGQSRTPDDQNQNGSGNNENTNDGLTEWELNEALENALFSNEALKQQEIMDQCLDAPSVPENLSNDNMEYVNGNDDRHAASTGWLIQICKKKENPDRYDAAYAQVKKYVPAMAKALRIKTQERDYQLQGCKSGKLNTNKLVSLKAGNPNVFSRKGSITTDAICLCVLIDESGSMSGERCENALKTAVLINEAVKKINAVEMFAYGFEGNKVNVYCERRKTKRKELGSIGAWSSTPTAEAMEIAAMRIRKHTSAKCLMIIITDGEPDDIEKTRIQDKQLRKQGILPVGVDISGGNAVKKLFIDAIAVNHIADLAPEVQKLIRKKLDRFLTTNNVLS